MSIFNLKKKKDESGKADDQAENKKINQTENKDINQTKSQNQESQNKESQNKESQNKECDEIKKVSEITGINSVKILGSGCDKCNQLEAAARSALEQLGIDVTIQHITDFGVIAEYGVMTTPALVVNETVLVYGKVLKADEVKKLITKHSDWSKV